MKKTLLAALAFIMVLATVLTCTVLAADGDAAPQKVADIKQVDAAHPIIVDGKMDQAYEDAIPMYIGYYSRNVDGIYTCGFARFVWSPSENAVYCYVIMNDADVGETFYNEEQLCLTPWAGDSVELFVDFNADGLVPEGGYGKYVPAGMDYERGFQYRIDGHTGLPSCLLVEEPTKFAAANPGWTNAQSGQGANVYNGTYQLNEETGKLENMLDSAMADYFGWGYSDDDTKIGWGHQPTEHGYAVEFRIECKERTLAVGDKVYFDIQVNDMYEAIRRTSKGGGQLNIYYSSELREQKQAALASRPNYDWLVLSSDVATNDAKPMEVDDKRMYDFGMADIADGPIKEQGPTEITQTVKKTWSRRPTGATVPGGDDNQGGDNTQQGGNNQGGDNTQQGGNNQGGTTEEPAGGCGSTVTVSASIAAVAAVALGGAFAFRRKDEE